MTLPNYTVKESARAKYVRLKISAQEGLVIVVPKGFNRCYLPNILQQRRAWIEKHLNALKTQPENDFPPTTLELLAIGEKWELQYLESSGLGTKQIDLEEKKYEQRLIFSGNTQNTDLVKQALHQWLLVHGRKHLEPWLKQLSLETNLYYKKLQIRKQKTRWGSCSNRLTISLNYKLLFLPRQLARYVLLHELAHTRHLNHSKQFWTLLGQLEANYQALDQAVDKVGQQCVPIWL